MLENQTALINAALESCFDRVLDLFDGINMAEHKNELLCFTGIDSYKLSEPVDSGGSAKRTAEVKYLIKALAKKNMSAEDICAIFDDKAVPAIESCGADIKEIKRNSCVYSKENGTYIVSAELTVLSDESSDCTPDSIGFSIGTSSLNCMKSFEISRAAKTAETPTIGGGIRSRMVGVRPLKITVKGEAADSFVPSVYSALSSKLGTAGLSITVGGLVFGGMAMTGLDIGGSTGGSAKLAVEFTEVTDS